MRPVAVARPEPDRPRYWTRESQILIPVMAGMFAADALTTDYSIRAGADENNPVARPFVTRSAGHQALYWGGSYGAVVATSYLLHRTGHEGARRWLLRAVLMTEAVCIGGNVRWITAHGETQSRPHP